MPVVTISRGTFSGGRALAECLAARLGYQCLSREVILDAANEYGIPADKLTAAMEKAPSFWQQLTGERIDYLAYVRAALCERAREGNLVYHGHAAHLLLAGISHVMRVRVVADMEYRVKAAMRDQRLPRERAVAYIKKVDEERVRWTRFLYGVQWGDPTLYDVVLNLTHVTIDDACEILALMAKQDTFQPTAESIQAMEDLALGCRVWTVLARDPRTSAADLTVVAARGIVTVTGTTGSETVVENIPTVASQVEGVRDVRCEVGIGLVWEPIRKPRGTRLW